MQRGGGEAATAPLQTTPGAADHLSVAAPGRCPVQRARQDAHRRTDCVNAGLHGPGVATRTGAGMLLLHLPARGLGGASGKPPPITQRGGAATTAQGRGCGGSEAAPASSNDAACRTTPQTNQTAQRPCSKRRRGDASPAPFCCPPQRGTGGEWVAVFTRKGARHNGLLCEPAGRAVVGPACFA